MTELLTHKNAIVYGGGGSIGGAITSGIVNATCGLVAR
jgi:FlaA1/EpsC-like NDP-sugar epimerase